MSNHRNLDYPDPEPAHHRQPNNPADKTGQIPDPQFDNFTIELDEDPEEIPTDSLLEAAKKRRRVRKAQEIFNIWSVQNCINIDRDTSYDDCLIGVAQNNRLGFVCVYSYEEVRIKLREKAEELHVPYHTLYEHFLRISGNPVILHLLTDQTLANALFI